MKYEVITAFDPDDLVLCNNRVCKVNWIGFSSINGKNFKTIYPQYHIKEINTGLELLASEKHLQPYGKG